MNRPIDLPRTVAPVQNVWTKALDDNTARTQLEIQNQDTTNALNFMFSKYPWALSFDGTGDDVDITAALTATLLASTKGSITLWVKRDSGGAGTDTIWSAGDTDADEYIELTISDANKLTMKLRTAAAIQWAFTGSTAIPTGEWVKIKLWHDGTAPRLFVNGDEIPGTWGTDTDQTAWFADLAATLDNMYIGSSSYGGAGLQNSFRGDICFCQIHDGIGDSMSSLRAEVARYEFKDGTGATITDDGANGDDGTITNATWASKSPGLLLPADSARILLPDQGCQDTLWLLTASAAHGTVVVSEGVQSNPVRNQR